MKFILQYIYKEKNWKEKILYEIKQVNSNMWNKWNRNENKKYEYI